MTERPNLHRLADRAGILPGYWALDGVRYETSDATREAILEAMGLDGSSEIAAACGLEQLSDSCVGPPEQRGGGHRVFGFLCQLYALRGRSDWGIGDLGTLAELVDAAGPTGAAFIGVQPLHVLSSYDHPSPFSPASRWFRDPIHIDLAEVYATEQPGQVVDAPQGLEALGILRYVDYRAVWTAKRPTLENAHRRFQTTHVEHSTDLGQAYVAYREAQGELLQRYAAIAASNDPSTSLDFHTYLQWVLDRQLEALSQRCRQRGLAIGLYGDLAVGLAHDGIDARIEPGLYARGVSLGAPPDPFAQGGQTWGLMPFVPHRLEQAGFAPFRELIRRNMKHFGALRIDHAMGLERQFWIPAGQSPKEGAYVRFPVEDLLTIVAQESRRHGCLVIGEDLGTVPEGFRERIQQRGILRSQVLYFERNEDRTFRAPGHYDRGALATVNTHDLPTLKAFWEQAAADERQRLLEFLERVDLRPRFESFDELSEAVHQALASGPSVLVGVSVDDLAGEIEPVNVPGTTGPRNWRRRLPQRIGELLGETRVKSLLETVGRARRSGHFP